MLPPSDDYDSLAAKRVRLPVVRLRHAAAFPGQSMMLAQALTLRFGALPEDVRQRLACADGAQLAQWARRVFDAGALDDLFA